MFTLLVHCLHYYVLVFIPGLWGSLCQHPILIAPRVCLHEHVWDLFVQELSMCQQSFLLRYACTD